MALDGIRRELEASHSPPKLDNDHGRKRSTLEVHGDLNVFTGVKTAIGSEVMLRSRQSEIIPLGNALDKSRLSPTSETLQFHLYSRNHRISKASSMW